MFNVDMNDGSGRYIVERVAIEDGEAVFWVSFMGDIQKISAHDCKPCPYGVTTWCSGRG